MFSKIKQKKAPLSLSSVSNALRNSGSVNLSPDDVSVKNLTAEFVDQFGVPKSSIEAVAFDPVQSLLAISTKNNEVRVFGQNDVEVAFGFSLTSPITILKFVKGVYLVAVSPSSGGVMVISLHTKQILNNFLAPGTISSVEVDPALDWMIIGLSNGSILFYDVDRLHLTPLKLDNLQKKVMPKQKLSPVVSVEWNPRDIGTILVAYSHCAILYSIVTGEIKNVFVYQLTKECSGFEYSNALATDKKKKIFGSTKEIIPEIREAHFHPNGLHILTVHKDNTLVFFDANDGTLLQARTFTSTNLHKNGVALQPPDEFVPILNVRWLCGADPENTMLIFSGGDPANHTAINVINFGLTLKYTLTAHEKQSEFYARPPYGQISIPYNFNGDKSNNELISSITPLPEDFMPYFNGNQNPLYLFLLGNEGSIGVVSFSLFDGGSISEITRSSLLPLSLVSIHPPVIYSRVETVPRIQWYGVVTHRSTVTDNRSSLILQGGAPSGNKVHLRPLGANEANRNILISGHAGGVVSLRDISRGEIDHSGLITLNLNKTLYYSTDPRALLVVHVSCSFESKEVLVGLGNGHVVVCKFGKKPAGSNEDFSTTDYNSCPVQHSNGNASILNIFGRFQSESSLLPVSLIKLDESDEISCLKMSNIGFAAIGYKSGRFVVCDITRGPAVILNSQSLSEFIVSLKTDCYATTIEFAIMEYGKDGYSSIVLYVGTNEGGNLLMFKIIPESNGGFRVDFADKSLGLNYRALNKEDSLKSKLDSIITVNAKNGSSACASLEMFHKLSQGIVIPGFIITTSNRDIRVLQSPRTKLSHKVIDENCLGCNIIDYQGKGIILAALVLTGYVKLMSIPSLSDIGDIKLSKETFQKLLALLNNPISECFILENGDIIMKTSPTEYIDLSISMKSHKPTKKDQATDQLFNLNALIPPRPTTSALQWAKGYSKMVKVEELAFFISGPNRKPAKHEESQLAHNISPETNPIQSYAAAPATRSSPYDSKGEYKEPVRKATSVQNSGFGGQGFMRNIQSGLDNVEGTVNGYLSNFSEDLNETYSSSKKSFYSSAVKSKFGF